jgi:hypothetical protein
MRGERKKRFCFCTVADLFLVTDLCGILSGYGIRKLQLYSQFSWNLWYLNVREDYAQCIDACVRHYGGLGDESMKHCGNKESRDFEYDGKQRFSETMRTCVVFY